MTSETNSFYYKGFFSGVLLTITYIIFVIIEITLVLNLSFTFSPTPHLFDFLRSTLNFSNPVIDSIQLDRIVFITYTDFYLFSNLVLAIFQKPLESLLFGINYQKTNWLLSKIFLRNTLATSLVIFLTIYPQTTYVFSDIVGVFFVPITLFILIIDFIIRLYSKGRSNLLNKIVGLIIIERHKS